MRAKAFLFSAWLGAALALTGCCGWVSRPPAPSASLATQIAAEVYATVTAQARAVTVVSSSPTPTPIPLASPIPTLAASPTPMPPTATTQPTDTPAPPTPRPTAPKPRPTATVPPSPNVPKGLPGQGETKPMGEWQRLAALLPAADEASEPNWLQEGTRVTYRFLSSTADADNPSDIKATGAGFARYDVVAMEGDAVVTTLYILIDTVDGKAVVPSAALSSVGRRGIGDFWVSPEALERAEEITKGKDNVKITRGPLKIGDKTYQAARVETKTDDGLGVYTFDTASGLLLFHRSDVKASGHQTLVSMTLADARQIAVPWQAKGAPSWVKEGVSLAYEGTQTFWLPDGSAAGTFALTISAVVRDSGERWSEQEVTYRMQGQGPSTVRQASGVAQTFNGYWLPAEALKALRNGQVLDQDAVTGTKLTVRRARDGTVTLIETGPAYQTALSYDPLTGALVAVEQEVRNGNLRITATVRLTEQP